MKRNTFDKKFYLSSEGEGEIFEDDYIHTLQYFNDHSWKVVYTSSIFKS